MGVRRPSQPGFPQARLILDGGNVRPRRILLFGAPRGRAWAWASRRWRPPGIACGAEYTSSHEVYGMRVTWLLLFVYGVPVSCPAVRANPKPAESPQAFRHQVGAEASSVVRAILRNYQLMKSLHFVATIIGRRGDPTAIKAPGAALPVALKARYVFWGAGPRYRINYSVVLPIANTANDCQVAFDGRRFQYLAESNRSLFIDRKRPGGFTGIPTPVNPALEPATFLAPFWPFLELGGHRLSLWHLRQPRSALVSGFWRRFSRGGRILYRHGRAVSTLVVPAGTSSALSSVWQQISRSGRFPRLRRSELSAGCFPVGAVGGGKGFSYAVTLSRRLGRMPRQIQVIDRLGKCVETLQFRYRTFEIDHSSVYVPSRIEKTIWGWGYLPSEKVTIRLHHIAVGGPPPPNIFVIDFHLANIVVDGQAKKVIPVPETNPR